MTFYNMPCVCLEVDKVDVMLGDKCSHCGGWFSRGSYAEPAGRGCGQCAGMVEQCRAARYCACYRVPFEAAADARRAHERRVCPLTPPRP